MNTRLSLDAETLRFRIASLLISYPDLAEDEQLRFDTIEGETDTYAFLGKIMAQIETAWELQDGIDKQALYHKERIAELKEREDRFDRRIEALKSLALSVLQVANMKRAELPGATLSIRNNPPRVVVTTVVSADQLPDELCRIKREVNKSAVDAAVMAGRDVPGFVLNNGGISLQVRTK